MSLMCCCVKRHDTQLKWLIKHSYNNQQFSNVTGYTEARTSQHQFGLLSSSLAFVFSCQPERCQHSFSLQRLFVHLLQNLHLYKICTRAVIGRRIMATWQVLDIKAKHLTDTLKFETRTQCLVCSNDLNGSVFNCGLCITGEKIITEGKQPGD